MKRIALLLLLAAIATTNYQCKSPTSATTSFTFTIEEDTDFTGLPALQSFAFGETDSCWLMFGGRTNGFHGFYPPDQDFPYKKANQHIYVYNKYTHVLDSMSTDSVRAYLRPQFVSTNTQNRQVDGYLYVAGGYGVINPGQKDSTWITHNIMSRVNIQKMIDAVRNHDGAALNKSVVYFTNDLVRATGGELYKMPDGKFYLCVGHNFTGAYSNTTTTTQVYLDEVRAFKLLETEDSITMIMPINLLNDGLPDSTTQFRRRDLVVSPNVLAGGSNFGISIYGGVFTYTSGCPSCNGGNPFRYPIYITGGNAPAYKVDSTYTQASNIYSAPNLQMYDSLNDEMYTTIFGGLGDTLYPGKTDTTVGDNASFTKLVMTVARNNKTNVTRSIYNPTGMPQYLGAEGLFIRAAGAPVYNNNKLSIIDYQNIQPGITVLGYIYGGILSGGTESGHSNPTQASNKVYKITVTKN